MGYKTYTCPIARSCGGCEWLAVPYPIQLKRKRQAVEDLFSDLPGWNKVEFPEVVGMGTPLGYRHKAATPFAPGARGSVRSGFYARGTHRIVPCSSCLVEAPNARKTLGAVARVAGELRIPAYDEDRGRGFLRHAVVRVGWKTNECLLTLVTNGRDIRHPNEVLRRIRKLAPQVTAIAQNVNVRKTNAILGHDTYPLLGKGRMRDKLLGCTFEMGSTSFYQTNPQQTEQLYSLAIEGAQLTPGMRLLDAYCGIGTIGICAARLQNDIEVVGVEQVDGAVGDARTNARLNHLEDRCRFLRADATAYMHDSRQGREGFDVIVMDPPRAGSTPEFLAGAAHLVPERIVYISCNPTTQRRDIELLLGQGYLLERLTVVDMFPHTSHAETVGILRRK